MSRPRRASRSSSSRRRHSEQQEQQQHSASSRRDAHAHCPNNVDTDSDDIGTMAAVAAAAAQTPTRGSAMYTHAVPARRATTLTVVPEAAAASTTTTTMRPTATTAQQQQRRQQRESVTTTTTPRGGGTTTINFLIAANAPASPLNGNDDDDDDNDDAATATTTATHTKVMRGDGHDSEERTTATTNMTNPDVYSCFSTNVADDATGGVGGGVVTDSEGALATATDGHTSDTRRAYSLHTAPVTAASGKDGSSHTSDSLANATATTATSAATAATAAPPPQQPQQMQQQQQQQRVTSSDVTSSLRDRAHALLVQHILRTMPAPSSQQQQRQRRAQSLQPSSTRASMAFSPFAWRMPTPLPLTQDTPRASVSAAAATRSSLTMSSGGAQVDLTRLAAATTPAAAAAAAAALSPPHRTRPPTSTAVSSSSPWVSLRGNSSASMSATSHTLRGLREAMAAAAAQLQQQQQQQRQSTTMATAPTDELAEAVALPRYDKSGDGDAQPHLWPFAPSSHPLYHHHDHHRHRGHAAADTPHKGVTHVVQQVRNERGRCTFDCTFLALRVDDAVVFRWYDARYHVFEVDKTYRSVVVGGQHSLQHSGSGSGRSSRAATRRRTTSHVSPTATTDDEDDNDNNSNSSDDDDTAAGGGGAGVGMSSAMAVRMGRGRVFYTHFHTPGDYYFVCTRSTHTMRLHVQVTSRAAYLTARVLPIALLAAVLIAVIVLVAVFLSYWLQRLDLFLRRDAAESPQQYAAVKRLQSILTLNLFPWVATGVLVLIFTAVLATAWSLTRRWRRRRSGAGTSYRGVRTAYRAAAVLLAFALALCIIALLFVCYGLVLNVSEGITHFTVQLSGSLVNILDTFAAASAQGRWLVQQARQVFPDVQLPERELSALLVQINATLTSTARWTRFGEDAAQGISRVLPILLFLVMQLGLLASALLIGALLLRFRRPLNAVAWLTVACVGVYACLCGAAWSLAAVLRELTTGATLVTDSPGDVPGEFGIGRTTAIAELFAACNMSAMNTQPLQTLLRDIMLNARQRLDAGGQTQFDIVFGSLMHLIDVAPVTLSEYTGYVMANLDVLQGLVNTHAIIANANVSEAVVPFISVAINLVRLLMSLIDCRVFRNAVAQALPTLHDDIARYHRVLLVCAFVLFGIGVAAAAMAVAAAYCMANPRRRWYEPRTRRWFRFRYCYKVHEAVLLHGRRPMVITAAAAAAAAPPRHSSVVAAAVSPPQPSMGATTSPFAANDDNDNGTHNAVGWQQQQQQPQLSPSSPRQVQSPLLRRHQHHHSPHMFRFISYKLVLYAASLLMFLDSIVLALFLSLARSIVAEPMLRALAYMQCAQLLFVLLASVSSNMLWRRLMRGVALLLIVACFAVAAVEATLSFVRFGTCLVRVRYIDVLTAGGNPLDEPAYATCSAVYVGMKLESAVYATVTLLNSVTVFVAMLYVELRERRGMLALARRRLRYSGMLAPVLRGCGLLRRVFAHQLLLKRLYTAVFIVVVVVLLVLFAVVDITHFRIVTGSWDGSRPGSNGSSDGLGPPPTMVLDASVACNGAAAYCALRVNEYVWGCTHNSYSTIEDGFVAPNHYYGIASQLQAGVRAFMLDLHDDLIDVSVSQVTEVYLCHSTCLAGRTLLREALQLYKLFLDNHPGQVLLINFEQYTSNVRLTRLFARANLTSYVWHSPQTPPARNAAFVWPTLGELVASGKRLLVFNDVPPSSPLWPNGYYDDEDTNGDDARAKKAAVRQSTARAARPSSTPRPPPPWLHYAYDYQYENNFTTTNVSAWQCEVTRGGCYDFYSDSDSSGSRRSHMYNSNSSENVPVAQPGETDCRAYAGPWQNGGPEQYTVATGVPPPLRAKLSTLNHMVTIGSGSPVEADVANTRASLLGNAVNCSSRWHVVVNIVAFDFWSLQSPLATVDAMNRNLARYGAQHNFSDKWWLLYTGQDL